VNIPIAMRNRRALALAATAALLAMSCSAAGAAKGFRDQAWEVTSAPLGHIEE